MKENGKHVIIKNMVSFNLNIGNPAPQNAKYDLNRGAWISDSTNDFITKLPEVERPSTKKNDVETGEDLKSE